MSGSFGETLREAVRLNNRKNEIGTHLIRKIGSPSSRNNPNHGIQAIAKTIILSACKLSGQIIDAVRLGHLLLAVIGMRTLFEIMINTTYIFNHPKAKRDVRHMRRVCKDILRTTNKKRGRIVHSRIDGKGIEARANEIGLLRLYKTSYRGLSDWSHLAMRTPFISQQEPGEKFGIVSASQALTIVHDILDSICEGLGYSLDKIWTSEVIAFRDEHERDSHGGRNHQQA